MVESQNMEDLASGSTAVDSQQDSQATEVVTQVEVRFFPVLRLKIIQTTRRKETVPSPLTGLKRLPRWDKIFQMRYLPAEAECILYCLTALCTVSGPPQHCCYAFIFRSGLAVFIPDRRL
jgi:hypothetical protein